jgi:hypothetical protein
VSPGGSRSFVRNNLRRDGFISVLLLEGTSPYRSFLFLCECDKEGEVDLILSHPSVRTTWDMATERSHAPRSLNIQSKEEKV